MCTVTVIPIDEGVRLAFNRDELRSRAIARPPAFALCGRRRAIFPVDPDSGGTWVAANDAGLLFAVLNVNSGETENGRSQSEKMSRGRVIPALLPSGSIDDAVLQAMSLAPADFAPFRLLALDRWELLELVSDGEYMAPSRRPIHARPICFTSSGLGDSLVQRPRLELFQRFAPPGTSWHAQRQDEFHRHSWPDRNHLSVCMRRDDASTVSYSTVELRQDSVRFDYYAGPPDESIESTSLVLQIHAA